MAFEDLKEQVSEAEYSLHEYKETSLEYYKLKSFKFMMKGLIALSKIVMLGFLSLLVLVFLSVSASYALGEWIDNIALGFLMVGGFYAIVFGISYLLRNKLEKPFLKKFSEFYYDEL